LTQPFCLGTRGSELALCQTRQVAALLSRSRPEISVEEVVISTIGDRKLDVSLAEAGRLEKGLFTKELDESLLAGKTHASVHSLKDLPTERPHGLVTAAILPRVDWRDVLLSKYSGGLLGLPPGARVATGSPRREAQIRKIRPDLRFLPIRGNVPTRVRKLLQNQEIDATVLAAAGLLRLGLVPGGARSGELGGLEFFYLDEILPAPGQAAIAVETPPQFADLVSAIDDRQTAFCTGLERRVLFQLGGGCHLALGALAQWESRGVTLRAFYQPDPNGQLREASLTFAPEAADDGVSSLVKQLNQ